MLYLTDIVPSRVCATLTRAFPVSFYHRSAPRRA